MANFHWQDTGIFHVFPSSEDTRPRSPYEMLPEDGQHELTIDFGKQQTLTIVLNPGQLSVFRRAISLGDKEEEVEVGVIQ